MTRLSVEHPIAIEREKRKLRVTHATVKIVKYISIGRVVHLYYSNSVCSNCFVHVCFVLRRERTIKCVYTSVSHALISRLNSFTGAAVQKVSAYVCAHPMCAS